jgi:hypothetical protein
MADHKNSLIKIELGRPRIISFIKNSFSESFPLLAHIILVQSRTLWTKNYGALALGRSQCEMSFVFYSVFLFIESHYRLTMNVTLDLSSGEFI